MNSYVNLNKAHKTVFYTKTFKHLDEIWSTQKKFGVHRQSNLSVKLSTQELPIDNCDDSRQSMITLAHCHFCQMSQT